MNKQIIVLIVALFGMIVPISPLTYASVAPVHAATINNLIAVGYVNATNTIHFKFTPVSYLNVSAGSAQLVKNVKNVVTPIKDEYLALNFSSVTINSGQFSLYLSKNGLNIPTSGDILWLPKIFTSEVTAKAWTPYTYNGSTYYLGFDGIVGPAPTDAPLNTTGYFVKAYTGSPSNLPVSQTRIGIYPGSLTITPTSGPAGQIITVSGAGFSSNGAVEIYYTYHVAGSSATVTNHTIVTANSAGQVSTQIPAPELKLETPATHGPYPSPYNLISFSAQDTQTGLLIYSPFSFTELPREFTVIAYYSPATAGWVKVTGPFYNGTLTNVPFYETEPIKVSGNYFDPNSQVKLYFDGSLLATAPTNSTGGFTASANVPIVPAGTYTVNATDPLAYIYFSGKPVPEVVVTPNQVVPGQSIKVNGYAYTANSMVNATLLGLVIGMHNVAILTNGMNVPTNSLGEWSFSSTVPMAIYGGVHYINATDLKGVSAYAEITVNPLIEVSPSKAPLGSNVTVNLYGLSVGYESWTLLGTSVTTGGEYYYYGIAYDNILTYSSPTYGNMSGENSTLIAAAGYPMLHAVQLVRPEYNYPYYYPYTLVSTAWLNVTGTTNTEAQTTAAIKSMNATISSLPGQISSSLGSFETSVSSQLSSISSSISSLSGTMTTQLSGLSSSLSSMNASVSSQLSSISSSISSLSGTMTTQYSSIMSSLTSISTLISDLKTSLSSDYSSLSSSLSSLSSSVSTISSASSSISTTVSSISPSVSSLHSSVSSLESSVSSLTTYLLVVAVLAIIIIVLELVLLVRKK